MTAPVNLTDWRREQLQRAVDEHLIIKLTGPDSIADPPREPAPEQRRVDLVPQDGVWRIPAADPLDAPHVVYLTTTMGTTNPDGSPALDVAVSFSSEIGIITVAEARRLALVLLAAAEHAETSPAGRGGEARPADELHLTDGDA